MPAACTCTELSVGCCPGTALPGACPGARPSLGAIMTGMLRLGLVLMPDSADATAALVAGLGAFSGDPWGSGLSGLAFIGLATD